MVRHRPLIWVMAGSAFLGLNHLYDASNHPISTGGLTMIQTQQLSSDTLLVEMGGRFDSQMAKQLALLVFRSHRLGFTTFLLDLTRVSLMEDTVAHHLVRIGQGLHEKGGTWRVIGNPPSLENRLLLGTNLDQLPKETWN